MKEDIDSILNSMFRGGRLQLGSKEQQSAEKRAREIVQNGSLQEEIDDLTKEVQAEIGGLQKRLQEDKIPVSEPVCNRGSEQDLKQAFETAQKETAREVLGQENFLSALTLALRRPFVMDSEEQKPLGKGAVIGPKGTGKHTALRTMCASLARQGVLKNGKVEFLSLSRYGEEKGEKAFLQDLYSALKSGAALLVFEDCEGAPLTVLNGVTRLFLTGELPLSGRYAQQKGMLVDTGSALVPNAVSSLRADGRYLLLLTHSSLTKLSDTFGAAFLDALDDICETEPFSPEALLSLCDRALQSLCDRCRKKLGFSLTYRNEEKVLLAQSYQREEGVPSLFRETEGLFRALSEYRLKNEKAEEQAVLTVREGRLAIQTAEKVWITQKGESSSHIAIEAVQKELSEIVGLEPVKEYILSLEDHFKIQQLRKEKGLKTSALSMHMIFTGNPGTGKTTVARIVSRYLKAIGVLEGGQLIEVSRGDLVGKYVGHTAPLTQKALESALGGVLFIDEAYSLYRGRDDSFGLECIDTLVKGMEDHRENLLVILAGYSEEMEEFLTANSGLRSRFPNVIEFPDYTAEELLEITKSIVKGKGYRLDPACEGPLLRYYENAQRQDSRKNGNGRMARNKVEEAVLACSRRVAGEMDLEPDLELLLLEDFSLEA